MGVNSQSNWRSSNVTDSSTDLSVLQNGYKSLINFADLPCLAMQLIIAVQILILRALVSAL